MSWKIKINCTFVADVECHHNNTTVGNINYYINTFV